MSRAVVPVQVSFMGVVATLLEESVVSFVWDCFGVGNTARVSLRAGLVLGGGDFLFTVFDFVSNLGGLGVVFEGN